MRDLAVKQGIDASKVVLEDEATNTIENVLNTKDILEDKGIRYAMLSNWVDVFQQCTSRYFRLSHRQSPEDL
jgi:hypothetical protein